MTPSERMIAEKERILAETGFYVTPFRMSNLMKAAAKITDILVRADTNICYEECNIVLSIVSGTIACIMEGDKDDE
jgi:hypothetical protein